MYVNCRRVYVQYFVSKMNKKVCIISVITSDYIGGNLIDGIDLYYNLQKYIECDYFIFIQPNKIKTFFYKLKGTFKPDLYNNIIKHIQLYDYKLDFDKYDIYIYRYNYYKLNPTITQYKGIFLNSWAAVRELVYYKKDIFTNFKSIVSTPFILKYDTTNNFFIYFHKLSEYRINNLIYKANTKCFNSYNIYETLKANKYFNIHDYNKLYYCRHKVNDIDFYLEMKGKLIFEFLYFGKQVHYSPINKAFDDGLTDYLSLFGIDDNIEQDLNISKEEIYDKLVKFDENDELLQFIKMC